MMENGSEQTCLHLKNESGRTMAPQLDLKIVWKAVTQEMTYHFTKYNRSKFSFVNPITLLPKQEEGKGSDEEDQMEAVRNQHSLSAEQRTQLILASL